MKNRTHKKNENHPPQGIPSLAEIQKLSPEEIREMLLNAEKRIEEKTKESEQFGHINQLLEGAELIAWQWDIASGELFFNGSFETQLGYAPGEIGNINDWKKLVHPEDLPIIQQIMDNHLAGKTRIYRAEHRLQHKDGHWVWMFNCGKVVEWNTNHQPALAFGINQNISKNKQNLSKLEHANQELTASRSEALNMMEDSILSARKLESEHKLFSNFMETIPAAVFFKDAEDRFLTVNTELLNLLNKTQEQIIGKTEADFFPPDQAKQKQIHDQQVMKTGQICDIEEPVFNRWNRTVKAPRYDEDGNVIGIFGISLDITEQKRAQDALRQSEEQYRNLFENLSSGFTLHELLYDNQGKAVDYRFLQANPAFEKLTGLKVKDILGRTAKEVMPNFEQNWLEIFEQVVKTGAPVEFEGYSETFDKFFGFRVFSPAPGLFAVVSTDTSARHQAQIALSENEERLRTTLDSIGDAVISVDTNGTISSINRTAETLTGWNKVTAIGKPIGHILTLISEQTRTPMISPVETTLKTGRPSPLPENALLLSKTGEEIPINDSCAPIIDTSGNITGAVLVFRDQTTEREAMHALEESEKNLKKAQEIAKIGSWKLDLKIGYFYWSDEVFRIFEKAPDQFVPTFDDVLEMAHPDDIHILQAEYKNPQPHGHVEHRILLNDGSVKTLVEEYETTYDSNDMPIYAEGIVQDVTEKKTTEARLQHSNNLLRTIINTIPTRIFWKNLDGVYLGCNTAFALDAGFESSNELKGKTDEEMNWRDQRAEANRMLDNEVISTGFPILNKEEARIIATGEQIWTDLSKIPLTDSERNIIGILGVYRDITERKQMLTAIEKRITTLTRPLGDTKFSLQFDDLFDRKEMQRIQNEFCNATGVAAVITDPSGHPITHPSNFTRFCIGVVRKTQKGCANCLKSDAALGQHNPLGPTVQPCLSGGLWDAGVSIEVGGHHIANWLIGQVRDDTQTEDHMIAYAREIGANEDELIEAFREVPVMQKSQFESVAKALYTLVNQISRSAYQNLQQARFIAEQKEAGTRLRKLSDEQSLILNNSTAGIALIRNRIFEWVNPRLAEMLGVPMEQIQNHPTRAFYAYKEEYDQLGQEAYQTLKENEKFDSTLRLLHADGSSFWCRLTGKALNPNMPQNGSIWMFEDITASKQAESELRRLSAAIEQSPETVVITDLNGDIQYVNPAFEKSTGYTREEAIGKNTSVLKSEKHQDEFYQDMWSTLTAGNIWEGRIINRKKDGTLYTEEASIAPVRGGDGEITNYVAVKRDITQELVRNEQLKQAQKMEAVGQLAGGIAHDFNNILQAILGFSELLMLSLDETATEERESVFEIQNAAKHAAELTRQLLAFSRKEQGSLEQADLNRIIQNTKSFINSIIGENIKLSIELNPEPLPVRADSRQLERAILNIAINARDAMPNGGSLLMETKIAIFAEETAATNPKIKAGEFACLSITDTGTGIPKEIVERIFDPFFSTKAPGKGTGLGLAALYGIVQEHHGWINVYSEIDKGTAFSIYLPLYSNAPKTQQDERPNNIPVEKSGHEQPILLVEDDQAIRSMVHGILIKAGYNITCASSAEDAEQLFNEHNGNFSLLISDYILPQKTGEELAETLTRINPELPVIICSGYSGERVNRDSLEQKGFNFLVKPYSIGSLLNLVKNIFSRSN